MMCYHVYMLLRVTGSTQLRERESAMLQFVDRKITPPSYLEKVTLYFHPQGRVVVMMGKQHFHSTLEEVDKLIKNRLMHHAQYTELETVSKAVVVRLQQL